MANKKVNKSTCSIGAICRQNGNLSWNEQSKNTIYKIDISGSLRINQVNINSSGSTFEGLITNNLNIYNTVQYKQTFTPNPFGTSQTFMELTILYGIYIILMESTGFQWNRHDFNTFGVILRESQNCHGICNNSVESNTCL